MRGIAFIFLLFTLIVGDAAVEAGDSFDLKVYLYDSNGKRFDEQLDNLNNKVKVHYGDTVADLKKDIRGKLEFPIRYGEVYSKSLGKEIPFDDVVNIAAFQDVFEDDDEYCIHVEVEKVDQIDMDAQDDTPREPTYAALKNNIKQYYIESGYEIDMNYEDYMHKEDEKISMALFTFTTIVIYLLFFCRKEKPTSRSVHFLAKRHVYICFHFKNSS